MFVLQNPGDLATGCLATRLPGLAAAQPGPSLPGVFLQAEVYFFVPPSEWEAWASREGLFHGKEDGPESLSRCRGLGAD